MSPRPTRRIVTAGILIAASLSWTSPAAGQRGAPPRVPIPQGQRIDARDGDIINIEDDARVRIVRRRQAIVRTVFNPTARSLMLLVDYASPTAADGRVDMRHWFSEITGEWPLSERWEGTAVVEDYQTVGQPGQGMGLVLPQGSVQILSFSGTEMFRESGALGMVTYRGASGSIVAGGVSFDEAERRQLADTARSGGGQLRMGGGTKLEPEVTLSLVAGPPGESPVRVGSSLRSPKKTHDVPPVYPEAARQAGISGVVVVELTVAADGSVTAAKVLRSVPALDDAALEAAKQWRYQPELLDGKAVPFVVTAPVTFKP